MNSEIVARAGFEPAISALRGRRPKPLDERAGLKYLIQDGKWKLIMHNPT